MLGILGKKIGMTQIFDENGKFMAVSVIEAGPMFVTQIKTEATDGYNAVQVAFEDKKESRGIKPEKGHFEKSGVSLKKHLAEFRVDNPEAFTLGQEIKVDLFEAGAQIDVSGVSKGKGTAGAIKRWNQSRGPETHGSKYHRGAGSLGSSAYPARVIKGTHMAGRMGNEKVTVQNLEVVRVDAEKNLLLVKGGTPGPKGGILTIKKTVKNK
ncbi:MAG: 50S ribosomal protein L3 [delta proteobacterium ML8_F1]|nr:MAG: 50S ribosomal protein L3 [delta proteobacterium ML8_F1]